MLILMTRAFKGNLAMLSYQEVSFHSSHQEATVHQNYDQNLEFSFQTDELLLTKNNI